MSQPYCLKKEREARFWADEEMSGRDADIALREFDARFGAKP